MKILSSKQIREGDNFTIKQEPISSVDLMERAGDACFQWIYNRAPELFPPHLDEREYVFKVFCGVGNNGGDGLVIARLLSRNGYEVEVYIVDFSDQPSPDFSTNFQRIGKSKLPVKRIKKSSDLPEIGSDALVIDAIFGTGITRSTDGIAAEVIHTINASGSAVISIDMPSGLFDQDNSSNLRDNIVKATYTLTFQFLKLAFLLCENAEQVGKWEVLDIGLHPEFIKTVETDYTFITTEMVKRILKSRQKFSHKGTFGHAAIMAGSNGKFGAAVLCAKGALHSGPGLVTAFLPTSGTTIMHTAVPEAMVQEVAEPDVLSGSPDVTAFSAIGIGPGIGTSSKTADFVFAVLQNPELPTVVDADALNALAANPDWTKVLHDKIILTPHPGEFGRLVGEWENDFDRLMKQIEYARNNNCFVILKGAHSAVATPTGEVYFNSTGNPGMATGGSGDVLTGILTGILAQGYSVKDAAILGVYLHGKAADLAVEETSMDAMIASDLTAYLGKAFLSLNLPPKSKV